MPFVSHLECADCGAEYPAGEIHGLCAKCERPLWVRYDMDMIKEKFDDYGYELPNIVFWNLHSYGSQAPVSFEENGTALISGFSPAILKSILSGETFTPYSILMDTIGSERYSAVTI